MQGTEALGRAGQSRVDGRHRTPVCPVCPRTLTMLTVDATKVRWTLHGGPHMLPAASKAGGFLDRWPRRTRRMRRLETEDPRDRRGRRAVDGPVEPRAGTRRLR